MNIRKACFYQSVAIFISCSFLFGNSLGCSRPLRTLIGLGEEQKAQQSYVKSKRARFKVLLRDAQAGKIQKGLSSLAVVSRYGEPVLIKDGIFLYRDPVDFLNSPKVYMVFDENKKLTEIRIEKKDVR